jgi:ferrochelatase
MNSSQSLSSFRHDSQFTTGILITNLGTPDEHSTDAVRRFLREFLWDPRIVSIPRIPWWLILQIVLLIRPRKSARAYRSIWMDEGSPLMVISKAQVAAIETRVKELFDMPVVVELAMRYGNPSITSALEKLHKANAHRILVLPLFPQYSSCATASTFDAVAAALKKQLWLPELRFINQYHDHALYINALAQSIQESWQANGKAEMLLFSFHGLPKRLLDGGDPYHCQCQTTARLVAEKLGLVESSWQVTFQSRFGKEQWLQPYTNSTLKTLADAGIKSVDVVCPGFSADCLETLEEIAEQNRDVFIKAGGQKFRYIEALNTREDHINALLSLITENSQGWMDSEQAWDSEKNQQLNKDRAKRAESLGANI